MNNQLYINDLCKTFGSGASRVCALDHINFTIPDNSICGLLGKNGAGKTTLIKCATGLLAQDSGKIYLNGIDITRDSRQRLKNISVVLDGGRNLFPYMSVKENIRYFSILRKGIENNRNSFFNEIIEMLGLDTLLNKQVQTLSFGMRQRASIAVALACHTNIIFLDEPTSGLDIDFQEELARLLKKLQSEYRCTIIVSSHDMRFIEKTCSDCILIDHGHFIKGAKIAEFKNAFSSSQYVITCKQAITENILGNLNRTMQIFRLSDSSNKLSILWPAGKNIAEFVQVLTLEKCEIVEMDRTDDLAAVIHRLTDNRGKY